MYIVLSGSAKEIFYLLHHIFSVQKEWLNLIEKSVNNPSCWIWARAGHLELLVKNKNMTPFGSFMLQMLHLR